MVIAHSKLTAQGQISVPAGVRRKLGIGPGSVLEWNERGEGFLVRRVAKFSSKDIHQAIFSTAPTARTLEEMKAGIFEQIKQRHASR